LKKHKTGGGQTWNYRIYSLPKAPSIVIILEEDADTARVTAKQPARVIRVRRHVQAHPGSDSKVVRCLYTEEFPREASRTGILRRS
jgi:hypothetical protein